MTTSRAVRRFLGATIQATLSASLAAGLPAAAAKASELVVNGSTAGDQQDPAVAMDGDGGFVVVWYGEGPGDSSGVFARLFHADGTPKTGQFRVNTVTADDQNDASVAMNPSGAFVVVWESDLQDGDEDGVYARRFAADGTALDPVEVQVSETTLNQQVDPNVAMADDGSFAVAWEAFPNFDGMAGAVYVRLFGADGIPTTGDLLVNTFTDDGQRDPVIAMWPGGGFVVAWESASQDSGSTWGIFAKVFDATGAPLTGDLPVNTHVDGDQRDPFVAASGTGFVVVWQSLGQDGSDWGVYGRGFDLGGVATTAELQLHATTAAWQGDPCVAADGIGRFVVVFEDGPSVQDVLLREYRADGTPAADPLRVNAYTAGDQDDPELAMNAAGAAVVVWEGDDQDGDGEGILARLWSVGTVFADGFESGGWDGWSGVGGQ